MADMFAVSEQALTDIADAIRLKRDITTPLTVENMPLEISLIDGGGGAVVETVFPQSEGNIRPRDLFENNIIRCKYRNSVFLIRATGTTPATIGNYTVNNYFFAHAGTTMYWRGNSYASGRVGADSVTFALVESAQSFRIDDDGRVRSTSSTTATSCFGGAGTVLHVLELPCDFQNGIVDTTPFNS